MSVYYASWTRRLGFARYDAYTVDPAVYAASYIAPNGRLANGTNKDSPRSESLQGDEANPRKDHHPL